MIVFLCCGFVRFVVVVVVGFVSLKIVVDGHSRAPWDGGRPTPVRKLLATRKSRQTHRWALLNTAGITLWLCLVFRKVWQIFRESCFCLPRGRRLHCGEAYKQGKWRVTIFAVACKEVWFVRLLYFLPRFRGGRCSLSRHLKSGVGSPTSYEYSTSFLVLFLVSA